LNEAIERDMLNTFLEIGPKGRVGPGWYRSRAPACSPTSILASNRIAVHDTLQEFQLMWRKWTTLAVGMLAVFTLATGLSLADDESPLHKLMESVGKENTLIGKAVRTRVSYSKADKKDVVKNAEELIELGKKARDMKEAAEKQKKPMVEWTNAMDDFLKKTGEFKTLMAKPNTTFEAAKKSYATVKASCSACHNTFKVEDE
jgi:cytochrome c556